jgi:hypothetical protein
MPRPLALLVVATLVVLLAPRVAAAHDPRSTLLSVDVGASAAAIELQIPLEQLLLAEPALSEAPTSASAIGAYVERHLGARAADGRAFEVTARAAELVRVDDGTLLIVRASLHAPPGATARQFRLEYDGVVHRVVTHNVMVFIRRDLETGRWSDKPELIGMLHWQRKAIGVDRGAGSFWQGVSVMFRLGLHHIFEGADHLFFLLMLLLPAPLAASWGRWSGPADARRCLRQTAKLVTAFTVGHSLTLAWGALHGSLLPVRWVEVAIALSVLVSAVHAMRPLFAGADAAIAAGFGLVHGLAFASTLEGIGVDQRTLVLALLGFNLGIETMQLVFVTASLPWLLLLSGGEHFQRLRVVLAGFGAVAAVVWLSERTRGPDAHVSGLIDAIGRQLPWLTASLSALAVALAAGKAARVRYSAARCLDGCITEGQHRRS